MGRNGHKEPDLDREAAEKREALKRTAHALEDRLREKGHQVSDVVDRAKEQVEVVDTFILRHRYAILGGALGLGLIVGVRGRSRRTPRTLSSREMNGLRFVVERPRPSVFRSLFGAFTALAVRQAVAWATERLEQAEDRRDPMILPPAAPRASYRE